MKFAAFLVLLCASICIVHSLSVRSWGTPSGRILGTKNVTVASSFMRSKNVTFTYPPVNWSFFWL